VRRKRWGICTSGIIVMRIFFTTEKNRVYYSSSNSGGSILEKKVPYPAFFPQRVSVRIPMCRIEAIP
jgi:hypothetical protein